MERIKELGRYQKVLLLLLIVTVTVFTVVYSLFSSQTGFVYKDAFLEKREENGNTLYAGRIDGQTAVFTVGSDKSVTYRYGEKTYGPYTAKRDPSAVPKDAANASRLIGVEIREGEKVFFRGGILLVVDAQESYMTVYDENGMFSGGDIYVSSDGVMYDENGQIVDKNMPTVNTILRMMSEVRLTRRVSWYAWLGGLLLAAFTGIAILFADALFRFRMSFRIENAENVYPSDLEMISRYIGWTVGMIGTLVIFFTGLIL